MERIFADFTAQVFAFIRFDLSNQRHPRSISVKFGIAGRKSGALCGKDGEPDSCVGYTNKSTDDYFNESMADQFL